MAKSEDEIKDLKSMLLLAKKTPVNIGVCFGKKPAGAEVRMDRKRNPAILGREAKSAGETTKVASGTLSVKVKTATFNCLDAPPAGLGKHLKKFFKSIDIPLIFEIIDPDGKVVAEPDDDDDNDAAMAPASTTTETSSSEDAGFGEATDASDEADERESAEPNDTTPDPAAAAWTDAWANGEPKVAEAMARGDAAAAKVAAVRDFVLGKANAGQFDAALKALPSLMALLGPQASGTATPANAPATEPAANAIDPRDLIRRLGLIKPQLAGVAGPIGQKLTEMFQAAVEMVKSGGLAQAASGIGQIEGALTRIAGARTDGSAPASQSQTAETAPGADPKFARITAAEGVLRGQVNGQTAGDAQGALLGVLDTVLAAIARGEAETALAGLKRVQDGLKLQAEVDRLAPLVAKAASSGMVADVNALNNLFNFVADSVPAYDHARAMANLARVEEMIAAGATMDKSTQQSEVPAEVKPLATARLNWISTRKTMHAELSKLEAAIAKALADAGVDADVEVVGGLIRYIDKLDARLEAKLDAIVNAPAGERDKLKTEARGLIAEYRSVLQDEFFKDVDSNNGFMSVAVTSTAQAMLNDISGVLA